jgi:hypothetical protein
MDHVVVDVGAAAPAVPDTVATNSRVEPIPPLPRSEPFTEIAGVTFWTTTGLAIVEGPLAISK